jgi:nucleotidyltransferase/DNA polymerase involved in DNA repair
MHLDMDAFFAAVEQADNPEYLGKPVMVGGGERGVVCAASYEARRYGVHSAMPIFQAKKLCPHGLFLPVRMSRYKEISRRVMEILSGVSPLVEQLSIDEAFVDITGTEGLYGPARSLALHVKSAVREANRSHLLGRNRTKQVSGKDCLRFEQTRRAHHHRTGGHTILSPVTSREKNSRSRQKDRGRTEKPWCHSRVGHPEAASPVLE